LDAYLPDQLSSYAELGESFTTYDDVQDRMRRLARTLQGAHYGRLQRLLPPFPFPVQLPSPKRTRWDIII
jgi:hypothetical protein